MALIHNGIQTTLVAIDTADIANGDTATIYLNSRTRLFTFDTSSSEATKIIRPGPYYLRPHDYSVGVWVESIGNDYDVMNAGQIIGSILYSTNWSDGVSGMKIDLDNGIISIQDDTFGNQGIQADYNAGSPRMYVGDGSNVYWNFDGSNLTISVNANVGTGVGVIYKGGARWLYDFNPAENGGGITPAGFNAFLGVECGNLTMGSTATSPTEASYNFGAGYQSLSSLTTASQNVGIGYKALNALTSGAQNVGIGYQALMTNESGTVNVALGRNALRLNTGNSNVAIGSNALSEHTNTHNNVAIGDAAMEYDITGGSCVAIGQSALGYQTSGDSNVGLGYRAGTTQGDASTNLISPVYCIYIGSSARSGVAGFAVATCDTIINDTGIDGGDDGTYNAVTTTATEGNGDDTLTVNVTISGGVITAVVVNVAGTGYRVNDTITLSGLSGQVAGANNDGTFDVLTVGAEDDLQNEIVIGQNATGAGSNTIVFGNPSIAEFHCQVALTVDSDERIKRDITPLIPCLDFINALNPVTYKHKNPVDWPDEIKPCNFKDRTITEKDHKGKEKTRVIKADKRPSDNETVRVGLLAHDVERLAILHGIKGSFGTTSNRGLKGNTYEALIMPLISAVQELSQKMDNIELQI
jgi:trimeric autotransporter adhesin